MDDEALEHQAIYKEEKNESEKNWDEIMYLRQMPRRLHGAAHRDFQQGIHGR